MKSIPNLWTPEEKRLLERLNSDIVVGLTLEILYQYQKSYIKPDWSKDVMGEVLLQADELVESRK